MDDEHDFLVHSCRLSSSQSDAATAAAAAAANNSKFSPKLCMLLSCMAKIRFAYNNISMARPAVRTTFIFIRLSMSPFSGEFALSHSLYCEQHGWSGQSYVTMWWFIECVWAASASNWFSKWCFRHVICALQSVEQKTVDRITAHLGISLIFLFIHRLVMIRICPCWMTEYNETEVIYSIWELRLVPSETHWKLMKIICVDGGAAQSQRGRHDSVIQHIFCECIGPKQRGEKKVLKSIHIAGPSGSRYEEVVFGWMCRAKKRRELKKPQGIKRNQEDWRIYIYCLTYENRTANYMPNS